MCIDSSVFEANFVDEFSVFIHVPCVLEKYILVYAVHSIRFDCCLCGSYLLYS